MVRRRQSAPPPTLPFDDLTCSVSELCAELRNTVRGVPARWVSGEVQRVRRSRAGHLYLELVEKGTGDQVVGKLESVIWRRDLHAIERQLRAVDQEIIDGLEIRCRGEVDFYPPFGRLQLVVREVDSVFLLGQLSRRRQQILQDLAKAGLIDRNRELSLEPIPLDVALVTSEGSAAYHDFLSTLSESGYGFRILLLHAAVQGRTAETEVASAVDAAAGLGVDCTVLIRGGGARADLVAFDSRRVAEAVARSAVPVITGLGHEIDLTIADQVAHTRAKTPTKAAELLVQRVGLAERALIDLAAGLERGSRHVLNEARSAIAGFEAGLRMTSYRVEAQDLALNRLRELLARSGSRRLELESRLLTEVEGRLVAVAPRIVGRGEQKLKGMAERATRSSRARLRQASRGIEALARLCSQLGPQRTLARGFTITRDARGRVVKASNQLSIGERMSTETARGLVVSRVEE